MHKCKKGGKIGIDQVHTQAVKIGTDRKSVTEKETEMLWEYVCICVCVREGQLWTESIKEWIEIMWHGSVLFCGSIYARFWSAAVASVKANKQALRMYSGLRFLLLSLRSTLFFVVFAPQCSSVCKDGSTRFMSPALVLQFLFRY